MHMSLKRLEIDMWLLLLINWKSYMESQTAPLDLTLSDLERSKSRSLRFQSYISKRSQVRPYMLLLTINKKPYMVSSMTP